ncbi:MAG: hypothetical protein GY801_02330 [bacterium]|nr:hypothetical protein [bacterium]
MLQEKESAIASSAALLYGLIINKLVSNALKYAFPDRQGNILVEMTQEADKRIVLRVSDSGVEFSADFDERQSTSLGIKLVRTLVGQHISY